MLALPGMAHAQSFTLPQECAKYGATGSEGDDPVVLVVDNYVNRWIYHFSLHLVSKTPIIQWGVSISPFRGGTSGYNIFTTYTPFLTSDTLVSSPASKPSYDVFLPQPGVTAGRKTAIYDVFTLTITDKTGKTPIPNAFVDFIPDFTGSSPLTMQANSSAQIILYCVQQNFQGYNITVYDANHQYLYDGSFPTGSNLTANSAARPAMGITRAHPDSRR